MAKQYDPETTKNMLTAFDTALVECNTVQKGIDSARGLLQQAYKGDGANIYQTSMQSWVDGFTKVYKALQEMNTSMGAYRNITENVKVTTEALGGWSGGGK